jgi:hypothetical protein
LYAIHLPSGETANSSPYCTVTCVFASVPSRCTLTSSVLFSSPLRMKNTREPSAEKNGAGMRAALPRLSTVVTKVAAPFFASRM